MDPGSFILADAGDTLEAIGAVVVLIIMGLASLISSAAKKAQENRAREEYDRRRRVSEGTAPPLPRDQQAPRPSLQTPGSQPYGTPAQQPNQPYAAQQPNQPYAAQQPNQPYAAQQPNQPYAAQQPNQPYAAPTPLEPAATAAPQPVGTYPPQVTVRRYPARPRPRRQPPATVQPVPEGEQTQNLVAADIAAQAVVAPRAPTQPCSPLAAQLAKPSTAAMAFIYHLIFAPPKALGGEPAPWER